MYSIDVRFLRSRYVVKTHLFLKSYMCHGATPKEEALLFISFHYVSVYLRWTCSSTSRGKRPVLSHVTLLCCVWVDDGSIRLANDADVMRIVHVLNSRPPLMKHDTALRSWDRLTSLTIFLSAACGGRHSSWSMLYGCIPSRPYWSCSMRERI